MAKENRISQANPITGAEISKQQANNSLNEKVVDNGMMLDNDKAIYDLVRQSVEFCKEQLAINLEFNSKVLTDVLYANIYKLLNGEIESDKFVQWAAQQLIDNGCVVLDDSSSKDDSAQQIVQQDKDTQEEQPKVDKQKYDELCTTIDATVEYLKANKPIIFKMFVDVDESISDMGSQTKQSLEQQRQVILDNREHIDTLVEKIRDNDEVVQNFIINRNSRQSIFQSSQLDIRNTLASKKINEQSIVRIENVVRDVVAEYNKPKVVNKFKVIDGTTNLITKLSKALNKGIQKRISELKANKPKDSKIGGSSNPLPKVVEKVSPSTKKLSGNIVVKDTNSTQKLSSNIVKDTKIGKKIQKVINNSRPNKNTIVKENKVSIGTKNLQQVKPYKVQLAANAAKPITIHTQIESGKFYNKPQVKVSNIKLRVEKKPIEVKPVEIKPSVIKSIAQNVITQVQRTKPKVDGQNKEVKGIDWKDAIQKGITQNSIKQDDNKEKGIEEKPKTNRGTKINTKIIPKIIIKTYRVIKKIVNVVKKVARAAKKVAKAGLVASYFVGKVAVKVSKAIVKGLFSLGRSLFSLGKKSLAKNKKSLPGGKGKGLSMGTKPHRAIINWSGAAVVGKFVLKVGWRAIKYVGKKLWKGLKLIFFKSLDLLKKAFKFGAVLVNKAKNYITMFASVVADKAYRFILAPIAAIVTTVIGFTMGVLLAPINFLKWIVPTLLDKLMDFAAAVASGVNKILRGTLVLIKKILFNPITIGLLIGGLFYFFWPHIQKFLTGGWAKIKETVIEPVINFSKKLLGWLKTAWKVVSTVGGFIFKAVEWLTRPNGVIAIALKGIWFLVNTILGGINILIGKTGQDNIDAFCQYLSGDFIGLALSVLKRWIPRIGGWLYNTFLKLAPRLVKVLVLFIEMYATWGIKLAKGILGFAWSIIKGDWREAFGKLVKPFTDWWDQVKGVWAGQEPQEIMVGDVAEANQKISDDAKTEISKLKMKGMNGEKVSKRLDMLAQAAGYSGDKSVVQRLETMNQLYQTNSEQVATYRDFIEDIWKMGNSNPDIAIKTIKVMLESPQISEKLLSAFYYYDPSSGNVMTTRPNSNIQEILNAIRTMVSDPNIKDEDKFEQLIMLFDQLNTERTYFVNKQGQILTSFAKNINNMDLNNSKSNEIMKQMVKDLNEGSIFKDIDVAYAFNGALYNNQISQNQVSVTGKEFGNNYLLKANVGRITAEKYGMDKSLFNVNTTQEKQEKREKQEKKDYSWEDSNIILPPSMKVSPPTENTVIDAEEKSLYERWSEHEEKRREMFRQQIDSSIIDQTYEDLTYAEYKEKYGKKKGGGNSQKLSPYDESKKKKLQQLRLIKDIQAYNNQGKVANTEGFVLGEAPSTLQILTDGLQQKLYKYSPEWFQIQGSSKETDEELLAIIGETDQKLSIEIKKRKEEEQAKKDAEERERKREQEILDYSATVSGGFIEVKIGEDVTAMMEAWNVHMAKRKEAFDKQIDSNVIDEMGLKDYTWEEWKVYYRKMHGLPEDGIRRIPFEGKRKERKIDWNERYALSSDELAKYGITVSEDGPVMIPLDKAMEVSNSLLNEAKSIYSIRDGLEVMKEGLIDETKKLKKRREDGMPFASISTIQENESPTQPV